MPDPRERSDLVLNPNEHAFVQDSSKGNISVYVGPLKASMSDTVRLVELREGEMIYSDDMRHDPETIAVQQEEIESLRQRAAIDAAMSAALQPTGGGERNDG